jgi:histidinol-phosphatase (PHP family)
MAWFSYHGGHSGEFCGHAKGKLEPVVQRAIEAGFTHYGLSEHCPRYRDQDLYGEEQAAGMTPASLLATFRAYIDEAFMLRERYADRIQVLVGFETERLPPGDWLARMRELRALAPFEYVIGSVHDVDGVWVDYKREVTEELAEQVGGRARLQARYFDDVADMVRALKPEVVGHIDLIRKFEGPEASIDPAAWPHLEGALEAVRDAGAALDVNCGASRRGLSPVYPLPAILKRAREISVGVTLGDDGHGAHDVGVGLDSCMQALNAAGYRELRYLARDRDGARGLSSPATWRSIAIEDVRPRA